MDRDAVKTAFVGNLGEGPLNFNITNPDAAGWLSFTPQAGYLTPSVRQEISLSLDSTGLGTGVYPTTLEFTSNDPDTPLVIFPVTMTVVSACVPVMGVDFTWTPTAPLPSQKVTFYASLNGSEPVSFDWEFSDGITSTAESPVRIFAPGVYTVTLTASNDCGSDDVTYTINIAAPPWRSTLPLVAKK
jgi:hypothetical protein